MWEAALQFIASEQRNGRFAALQGLQQRQRQRQRHSRRTGQQAESDCGGEGRGGEEGARGTHKYSAEVFLPARIISTALREERNDSACLAMPAPLTIDRVFHTPNTCGMYSCSCADRLVRLVVRDDPLGAVTMLGQVVAVALLLWLAVRRCWKGTVARRVFANVKLKQ
jgi:hypothetical protein